MVCRSLFLSDRSYRSQVATTIDTVLHITTSKVDDCITSHISCITTTKHHTGLLLVIRMLCSVLQAIDADTLEAFTCIGTRTDVNLSTTFDISLITATEDITDNTGTFDIRLTFINCCRCIVTNGDHRYCFCSSNVYSRFTINHSLISTTIDITDCTKLMRTT